MANELTRPEEQPLEVAKKAAAKPRNLAIGAVLLLLGIAINPAFIALAVVAYAGFIVVDVAMAAQHRAAASGSGQAAPGRLGTGQFAPEIAEELRKAHTTEQAINRAIEDSDHPFEDLREDVATIVSQMETSAKRAQMIKDTLDDQARTGNDERSIQAQIDKLRPRFNKEREVRELVNDLEAQRRSHVNLRESLERFKVNMARLNASLALMRNRLVEMSAAEEEALQSELAAQARDLRDRTERFTRVILETSESNSGDDLQRELDRDAASKGIPSPGSANAPVPLRNRAQPTPPPKPQAAPKPTPKPDPGPRPVPLSNRAAKPSPKPQPDPGPRPVPLQNRAKPTPKPSTAGPQNPTPDQGPPRINTRRPDRDNRS
jgi:predicted  nucleic acid-binding Zn-ribbon protein